MTLTRPGFQPNLKGNMGSTKFEKLFVKIPVESSMLFRFFNPSIMGPEGPTIWYNVAQHFNLKTEQGRGMAIADLSVHGTEETGKVDYINKLCAVLKKHGNADEKEVMDDLSTSYGWNAQVSVVTKLEDNTLKYSAPKILGLPITGARAVNKVDQAADMAGDASPFDVDLGYNIMITHDRGTPWYSALRAGQPIALDEIIPDWTETYIEDMADKISLKILTYDEQRDAVVRTFGKVLDFDKLQEDFGL